MRWSSTAARRSASDAARVRRPGPLIRSRFAVPSLPWTVLGRALTVVLRADDERGAPVRPDPSGEMACNRSACRALPLNLQRAAGVDAQDTDRASSTDEDSLMPTITDDAVHHFAEAAAAADFDHLPPQPSMRRRRAFWTPSG